jgi:hypothetical protein
MQFGRIVGLVIPCVLAGCGSSAEAPPLAPVSGTVTLNAKPLEGARVKFIPQGTTAGHGGAGNTDAEGKYEIIAHRSGNRKGLLPGSYKVIVSRMVMPDGEPVPPGVATIDSGARESVPALYSKLDLTPLNVTIGTEAQTFDWRLKK